MGLVAVALPRRLADVGGLITVRYQSCSGMDLVYSMSRCLRPNEGGLELAKGAAGGGSRRSGKDVESAYSETSEGKLPARMDDERYW